MQMNTKRQLRLKSRQRSKGKASERDRPFERHAGRRPGSNVIRTYIETLLELPWNKTSKDNNDISHAKEILEEDHYGLEQVKERVLEYLAVRS